MKVLLINVCLRYDTENKIIPVGLGYIASAVYRAGFDMEVVDIDLYRYSEQELEEILRKKEFDVVGLGCIVTGYKIVKNICAIIKRINKNAIIVVGNSVASSIPTILLSHTQADIAVIGEGDITIVELLRHLSKRESLEAVSGIYFKRDGKIIPTKLRTPISNLDSIPFPKWDLFEINTYLQESKNYVDEPYPLPKEHIRAIPVNTARGCAYSCTFCYHVFKEYKYRWRSPVSIIAEIKEVKKIFGINYVNFWDELTFFQKAQTEAFVDELIKEDVGIFWTASCRAGLFREPEDIQLAKKIKKSGCIGLGYSLESANTNILRAMNKSISKEMFVVQKKILDKAGIVSWTSLVFGYPEETEETVKETMEFCYENDVYPSAGFLLPQPGTPIYKKMLERGIIVNEEDYLLQMGDRQDLRINLTNIPTQHFISLVKEYLRKINTKLGFNIAEEKLIKSGHYRAKDRIPDERKI